MLRVMKTRFALSASLLARIVRIRPNPPQYEPAGGENVEKCQLAWPVGNF